MLEEAYEGDAVDVWSCGVILYALLAGSKSLMTFDYNLCNHFILFLFLFIPIICIDTPWDSPTTGSPEYEKYRAGLLNFSPWIQFSEEPKTLVRRMLAIDPKKRITMDEIFKHPWYLR